MLQELQQKKTFINIFIFFNRNLDLKKLFNLKDFEFGFNNNRSLILV